MKRKKIYGVILSLALCITAFVAYDFSADTDENDPNEFKIDGNLYKDYRSIDSGIGRYTIVIDGDVVRYDDKKYGRVLFTELEKGGMTFVPVRVVSEELGFKVDWDKNSKSTIVSNGEKSIKIKVGDDKIIDANTGSIIQTLPVKIFTNNDRMYLPLRAMGESLGYEVEFFKYGCDGTPKLFYADAAVVFYSPSKKAKVKEIQNFWKNVGFEPDLSDYLDDVKNNLGEGYYDNTGMYDRYFTCWNRNFYNKEDINFNANYNKFQSTLVISNYYNPSLMKDDGRNGYNVEGTPEQRGNPSFMGYYIMEDKKIVPILNKWRKMYIKDPNKWEYFFPHVWGTDALLNVAVHAGRKDIAITSYPAVWGKSLEASYNGEDFNSNGITMDFIELFLQEDKAYAKEIYDDFDRLMNEDYTVKSLNNWVELKKGLRYKISPFKDVTTDSSDNFEAIYPVRYMFKLRISLDRFWHN